MTDFGNEQPIEDVLEQRIPADDAEREADPLALTGQADWEASEADVVEQQTEVPTEDDRG